MSQYRGMVQQQEFYKDTISSPLAEHAEQFPELHDAFMGERGEDGRWIVGPATLMIFPEGDTLKFCLSPKYVPWVIFGCVRDPFHVFESVDQALASGACERKARSGGKRG